MNVSRTKTLEGLLLPDRLSSGLAGRYVGVARWESIRSATFRMATIEEEHLYLNGATVKRASLGFNGTGSWSWLLDALIAVRREECLWSSGQGLQPPRQSVETLILKLLATPSWDLRHTHWSPQVPWSRNEYAAIVLPTIDVREATRITTSRVSLRNPSRVRPLSTFSATSIGNRHDYA
jgi:hypothetical protein